MSKPVFILAHLLGNPNFYSSYRRLINNEKKTYAELLKEQEKNLRRIIEYSYRNVLYYHDLFKKVNLVPSDIQRVKDLEKLPIITKKDVIANWDSFKPKNLDKIKYYDNTTGGTTGIPFNYRTTSYERFFSGAIMYRGWGYAGYHLADRMVFLAGSSLGFRTSTTIMASLHEFARNIRQLSSFDMDENNLIKYVKVINPLNLNI